MGRKESNKQTKHRVTTEATSCDNIYSKFKEDGNPDDYYVLYEIS